jgi:hypothetical protein
LNKEEILSKIKSEITKESRTARGYGYYQKVILVDKAVEIIEKYFENI